MKPSLVEQAKRRLGRNRRAVARDVLVRAVAGLVVVLNALLRRAPRLHAPVVTALRACRVPAVDYARLNRDVARDLAILYAALPFSDTSANIAARRVRAAGVPVDVVCADMYHHAKIDRSADALWREYLGDLTRIPGKVTLYGEWGPTAEFCRAGMQVIESAERRKGDYRSVYSRTMFPAAHLLAAQYKLRHPGTRWVAEFSDPQLRDSRGGTRFSKGEPDPALLAELTAGLHARGFTPPDGDNVWEWAETATYLLADVVVFTNDLQRSYMLGYCADGRAADRAAARSEVIAHPVPAAELYHATAPAYALDPALVHVGYFGTFYPTRSLTEVVSALGELDAADRARLRLHVFAKKPDELRQQAVEARLADVLVVNGYVDFLDYLNLATRFDALLLSDYRTGGHHDVNPYLPAKYADYVGSGTPIWGIVEPGSTLSTNRLAHRSELGDVEGARRVLSDLARSHRG